LLAARTYQQLPEQLTLTVKCHDIVDKKRCHNIVEFVL